MSEPTAASIQERLREAAERWMPGVDFAPDLLRDAADVIEEQDREIARLQSANERLRGAADHEERFRTGFRVSD